MTAFLRITSDEELEFSSLYISKDVFGLKLVPQYLPRAGTPATLRGCVGTLQDRYIKSVSLPHIHAGTKRVPIARAATATQAIRVAILPIANMFARTHNPLP